MSDASRRAASGTQTATVFLIGALLSGTALAQAQPRITSRSGDTITLSVGAQHGVKAGMIGSVIQTVTAGGTSQRLTIARFTVERVGEASCSARLTQIGAGFEGSVVPGLDVEFDHPPLPQMAKTTEGATARFEPSGATFVWIPARAFDMGCVAADTACDLDEGPRHRVTLTRGFWMMATEVTLRQYREFARATGRSMPPPPGFAQDDDHPVVNVTWDEAAAYCKWARGRLPTEAEWESAARGGKEGLIYPWGHVASLGEASVDGLASRDQWGTTCPVRGVDPTGYGLYHAVGNVWEWCSDWYEEQYYRFSPSEDPQGPPSGTSRVLRGGSWALIPEPLRTSSRLFLPPQFRIDFVGLRCVRDGSP